MPRLAPKHKRLIIQRLACHDEPREVVDAVKEVFGLEITRQQVHHYNPENSNGDQLSQELRDLFYETRDRFEKEMDQVPIANRAFRLRELHKNYQQAKRMRALPIQNQILEQAAKEQGELYTNRHKLEHSNPDGTMAQPKTIRLVPADDE